LFLCYLLILFFLLLIVIGCWFNIFHEFLHIFLFSFNFINHLTFIIINWFLWWFNFGLTSLCFFNRLIVFWFWLWFWLDFIFLFRGLLRLFLWWQKRFYFILWFFKFSLEPIKLLLFHCLFIDFYLLFNRLIIFLFLFLFFIFLFLMLLFLTNL